MNPLSPIERAWHIRELIAAVVRRELALRFRGSTFGWLWAIFGPLIMLTFYTIVFSAAVGVPKSAQSGGVKFYVLSIYTGLTVFNLFSELAYRSPLLLHEHAHFVKKSIFPRETLAWIATIRALVYAAISFLVRIVFVIALTHGLPLEALLIPIIFAPFILLLLGVAWFLMALCAFTRDIAHLMATITPVLMFATPIFYSIDDVGAKTRPWMHLNLVGNNVEMIRDVLLQRVVPDAGLYLFTLAVSVGIFAFGYSFFMRYKAIFVDVI